MNARKITISIANLLTVLQAVCECGFFIQTNVSLQNRREVQKRDHLITENIMSYRRSHCNYSFNESSSAAEAVHSSSHPDNSNNAILEIPIFPLRKSAKLPTDELTLNLYEDRYLALSEYILGTNDKLFGSVYCSNKSNMIRRGSNPITPMLKAGDVGVIFAVMEHSEGMIPTTGGDLRRRIKLKNLAIGRFVIQRVLHDGINGHSWRPFILVEAQPLHDQFQTSSTTDHEEATLQLLLDECLSKTKNNMIGRRKFDDRELFTSGAGDISKLVDYTMESSKKVGKHCSNTDAVSRTMQRLELASFALASESLSNKPSSELEKLLKMNSTADRLKMIRSNIDNPFTSLFSLKQR